MGCIRSHTRGVWSNSKGSPNNKRCLLQVPHVGQSDLLHVWLVLRLCCIDEYIHTICKHKHLFYSSLFIPFRVIFQIYLPLKYFITWQRYTTTSTVWYLLHFRPIKGAFHNFCSTTNHRRTLTSTVCVTVSSPALPKASGQDNNRHSERLR